MAVEVLTTAPGREALELGLQADLVDMEADDIEAHIHPLLDQLVHRRGHVTVAGLLAVGEHHHQARLVGVVGQVVEHRR